MAYFNPDRYDVVMFDNHYFFFQPNGSSCYLYQYREDVRIASRAIYQPARRSIRPPLNKEEAVIWARQHAENPVKPKKILLIPITLDDDIHDSWSSISDVSDVSNDSSDNDSNSFEQPEDR